MNELSNREKAKQAAQNAAKPKHRGGQAQAQAGRPNPQGNNITFFGDDQSGFKVSPTKVMMFCLLYIGVVVALHIFTKVNKAAGGSKEPNPEM